MFVDLFYKFKNTLIGNKHDIILINNKEYKIIKKISEGGFGIIYLVEDKRINKRYAVKQINIFNRSYLNQVTNEINAMKQMNEICNNTIVLIDYEIKHLNSSISSNSYQINEYNYSNKNNNNNPSKAYLLLEYSILGNLIEYVNSLNKNTKVFFMPEVECLKIAKQLSSFLCKLHSLNPPIAHRDIKPDNILLFRNKNYLEDNINNTNNNFDLDNYKYLLRVCDFGSCSSNTFDFSKSNKQEKRKFLSEIEKSITLNYSPPEMIDTFSEYTVDHRVDLWMLGCTLYSISFNKYAFPLDQKLAIINCAYNFPKKAYDIYSEKYLDLIRMLINPNVNKRLSSKHMCYILENWYNQKEIPIKLSKEVVEIKSIQTGLSISDLTKINDKIIS